MRVVDYIAKRLAKESDTVFMLTGGGAMFLNDAFSWCEGITPVFCHHEQTCAMAAEAYARFNGKLGIANVTTGPGGINAINGVFGAWTDSIPMVVISGQVKRPTTLRATGNLNKIRQLGDQEVDIISLVSSITKMAKFVSHVNEIPFILEEAIALAKDGRPGPVWIDIPIDIQSAEIDPEKYFVCTRSRTVAEPITHEAVEKVLLLIEKSQKPVFLVGSAIRNNDAHKKLLNIAENLNVAICTSWTAIDAIDHTSQFFGERPGAVGTRAGNIILQQADLVIVLGSRLPIRQVSYNWENFAKNAIKVGVDVDYNELAKPMVSLDILINSEITAFVDAMSEAAIKKKKSIVNKKEWLAKIKTIRDELPSIDKDIFQKGHSKESLNPYIFIADLWKMFSDDEIVACADASASVIPFQIAPVKAKQRLFTNAGSASMGYELPAAIGAAFANRGKRVICLAGDGSIMLNIQELETIKRYSLPIKIIILNNLGYLSIKLSQKGFFGRQKGSGLDSGIGFPDFSLISKANDLRYLSVKSVDDYLGLENILAMPGPSVIEVFVDPLQGFQPKLGSRQSPDGSIKSDSLENMSPHLDAAFLNRLMEE
jgi:acetolactate synthase-1/2/3 large subunit